MNVADEIRSRVERADGIFETIKQLETTASSPQVRWKLSETTTRLQVALASLIHIKDDQVASTALRPTDKALTRAGDDVAFIAQLLKDGGPDAKWPN